MFGSMPVAAQDGRGRLLLPGLGALAPAGAIAARLTGGAVAPSNAASLNAQVESARASFRACVATAAQTAAIAIQILVAAQAAGLTPDLDAVVNARALLAETSGPAPICTSVNVVASAAESRAACRWDTSTIGKTLTSQVNLFGTCVPVWGLALGLGALVGFVVMRRS